MRKLFLVSYLLFISLVSNAQAPQAFNYQAAAYSISGNPIGNQLISLRISILDGSATGPIVYSESFSTTTDITGLFSISIGTGTVLSGNFSSIKWKSGSKWQKTEIDTAGGSNYVLMGTSQYLSVPYALYAQKSNGASLDYPDGTDNISSVMIPPNVAYIVPSLKNFYITNSAYNSLIINGDTIFLDGFGVGFKKKDIAASENSTIQSSEAINGFLVDKTVTWIKYDFQAGAYTVPPQKQLWITYWRSASQLAINGSDIPYPRDNSLLVDENQTLSFSPLPGFGPGFFIGFLRDK